MPGAGATLRLVRPGTLGANDLARWDDLGANAVTGSIFARPWFLRESLAHCDPAGDAVLGVVEDGGGRWLGVLPLRQATRRGRMPMPHWEAWRHHNQFVGTPAVRRGHVDLFWITLVEGLSELSRWPLALCLHDLPLDDPTNRALLEGCGGALPDCVVERRFRRAMLRPDGPGKAGQEMTGARQRRRIAGLERKLEREVGALAFTVESDPARVAEMIDLFLALEKSGWKGRVGSAIACDANNEAFFRAVIGGGAERGLVEVASLRAGERLLAISFSFIGEVSGFGFKTAYDEAYASYGPGMLLLSRLTGRMLELDVEQIDSCAAPDQQPVSKLWPQRRELVDLRVPLSGNGRLLLNRMMAGAEAAYHQLKAIAA